MNIEQTEFAALVQEAIAHPEITDWGLLWRQLDRALAGLPRDKFLRVAGEAIEQLAELCAARAESLLENWQTRYVPSSPESLTEPVLTDDLLASVLRHTISLNLEGMLEEVSPQQRSRRSHPEDSVVGDVSKQAVLSMVDQIEAKQAALATAYEESVSEWSAIVSQWISEREQPIDLETVLQEIQLSPVSIWLGLLLANPGFEWHHQWQTDDEFYRPANILISN